MYLYNDRSWLIDNLRSKVSTLNNENTFINPLDFAHLYLQDITQTKRFARQHAFEKTLDNTLVMIKKGDEVYVPRYLKNYRDPRVLLFNEDDVCVNKQFEPNTSFSSQVLKFNFNGWDQDLMGPRTAYLLSDICDYLFKTEGHKNIVIFDWSCSNLPNLPEETANSISQKLVKFRLGGGGY